MVSGLKIYSFEGNGVGLRREHFVLVWGPEVVIFVHVLVRANVVCGLLKFLESSALDLGRVIDHFGIENPMENGEIIIGYLMREY